MKEDRYMLIHMNKDVYRFNCIPRAKMYAQYNCRGTNEFYIIVDTMENIVIDSWSN